MIRGVRGCEVCVGYVLVCVVFVGCVWHLGVVWYVTCVCRV